METLKRLEGITEPDHRSTGFGVIDLSDGTARSMTLVDFYKHAEGIRVNQTAPEDVQSYMEAVKTLFAYGWYYYPFFTLSAFMATTAVEMALKLKLQDKSDEPWSLKRLFERAIAQGLLRDEAFPSREAIEANSEAMIGDTEEPTGAASSVPIPRYTERVAQFMRHFRNVFAHPSGHWILVPGQAINFLTLAGEVINQLWPGNAPNSAGNSESGA